MGELAGATGSGEARSETCGDLVRVDVRVEAGRIVDIRCQVQGCAAAIAGASMLCELAAGRSVDAALALDPDALERAFGGIPAHKRACLANVCAALASALDGRMLRGPA